MLLSWVTENTLHLVTYNAGCSGVSSAPTFPRGQQSAIGNFTVSAQGTAWRKTEGDLLSGY